MTDARLRRVNKEIAGAHTAYLYARDLIWWGRLQERQVVADIDRPRRRLALPPHRRLREGNRRLSDPPSNPPLSYK